MTADDPRREERRSRPLALLALLLLVPAPSVGTILGLWPDDPGLFGKIAYFASKVWLVALPTLWWLGVERGRASRSPARRGGFGVAIGLGLAISAAILGAFLVVGHWIPTEDFIATADKNGIGTPATYFGLMVYIVLFNAVLEEYVWRWFVVHQCETLLARKAAIVASALLFTVHHVFALMAQMPVAVTVLGSIGVFLGGVIWSWCYVTYRSIWPGYVSHAIVDVTIFAIGAWLLFGGS
ncbi:MAG: CPBP family intramembrane metalloprotease [Phycisphaerales bacterium]|nr:CPBP family intramembrane metalloprotease [Phycisphaerales bacterium]